MLAIPHGSSPAPSSPPCWHPDATGGQSDPERGQSIGGFVRGRRRARKLSQTELAELAGVGRRLVSEIERGKQTVRMECVQRRARGVWKGARRRQRSAAARRPRGSAAEVIAMRPKRAAVVSLDGTRAGLLAETETGTIFSYDGSYLERADAVPISFTLPLRSELYVTEPGIHPFFLNLLPGRMAARNLRGKVENRQGRRLWLVAGDVCRLRGRCRDRSTHDASRKRSNRELSDLSEAAGVGIVPSEVRRTAFRRRPSSRDRCSAGPADDVCPRDGRTNDVVGRTGETVAGIHARSKPPGRGNRASIVHPEATAGALCRNPRKRACDHAARERARRSRYLRSAWCGYGTNPSRTSCADSIARLRKRSGWRTSVSLLN